MQSLIEQTLASIDDAMMGNFSASLTCAADIKPRGIDWLWDQWLPAGKLTVLAGDGGTGKTTLLLGLIATITAKGRWPDGSICNESGNVLIWSSEDDPADTLIPRLMAVKANLKKIHIVQGRVNDKGEHEPFDPAEDMPLLKAKVKAMGGVKLMMLDPIMSAVKGDSHKANDVRRSLQPVVDFAADMRAAVVGITHFSKGSKGSSPSERVIGSQAFTALARMVWVAAKQEDGTERVLARAKSNISVDDGGISYHIEEAIVEDADYKAIQTTKVYWGGLVDGTAREILGTVEADETEDLGRSASDEVKEILLDILKNGPLSFNDVQNELKAAGHSKRTGDRVKRELKIMSRRGLESAGEDKTKWYWELPKEAENHATVPTLPAFPIGNLGNLAANGVDKGLRARLPTLPSIETGNLEIVNISGEL